MPKPLPPPGRRRAAAAGLIGLASTLALVFGLPLAAEPRQDPAPADATRLYEQESEVAPSRVRGQAGAAAPATAPAGPAASWIWGDDANRPVVLRQEFEGDTRAARLVVAADNEAVVSINGRRVARSDDWARPVERDVQRFVRPGRNEIVVEARNDGGPAGVALVLVLTPGEGPARHVVTDGSWRVAEGRDAPPAGAARVVGRMGDAPWGDVFAKAAQVSSAREVFEVPPGFRVDHLFTVPRDELGSWVALGLDDKGRLIASDQEKQGLSRITPPPIEGGTTKVEHLDVDITGAQGILHAFGSLYLSVNGGPGSGLYRVRDTDGDDQYDKVEKLASFRGGGEHGPHALRLAPDGESIYVVAGNHTLPPEKLDASRLPANWGEDLILPRQWDAGGHAVGILAPGGWIAKTDPDGETWELVSSGYRNSYDFAFNADGEPFAYDSDMEWDLGMPWYRPTRVTHAVSGSEFGWRSGTGKWPDSYPDSLPPTLEVGPGSPVGVAFGYGAKFPAAYQKALLILDWTFGTIYAVHLEPDGASYRATKEEFLSRTPLPLTDAVVGADGSLYFAIGGRGIPSELYRVVYVGDEPTDPVDARDPRGAELRALRRQIEKHHRRADHDQPARAAIVLWKHLTHPDRHIRYAARVGLEHLPVEAWQDRVFAETDPTALILGAVALARQGDASLQPRLLEALGRLDLGGLDPANRLNLLRAYQLAFIRMGEPPAEVGAAIAAKLDADYPSRDDALDRELAQLLVYLKSPNVVAKTIALLQEPTARDEEEVSELIARNASYGGPIAKMIANRPDAQKIALAFSLRNVQEGWTLDRRKAYFAFLDRAREWSGGASYLGFLNNIDKDAFENAGEADRLAIEASGARAPYRPKELPRPHGPGRDWAMADLEALGDSALSGRDFEAGRRAFAAARCVVCHRFAGEGGATGPDLTQSAGRFAFRDLAEAIVEPSKVVSDQYRATNIATADGQVISGRVVSESDASLLVVVDPEDSTKVAEVARADIEEMQPSPQSLMPEGLLAPMNRDEVLDLMAYLLSRGDPNAPMFRKR